MKRKIALLLSVALLLSGCSKNTTPSNTSLTTTTPPTPPTTTTTATTEEEPLKVEKKLEIFSIFESGYDDTIKLFEDKYGIPEKGETSYGKEFADSAVVITTVQYYDYYEELAKRISAGDSPDIGVEPSGVYSATIQDGFYQPIDDIIDTYSEEWSGARKYMDKLMYGGKNYYVIITGGTVCYFWYRNSILESAGLEDPYELYKKGEWNWDKYNEMADKFMKTGDKKFGCDGHDVGYAIVASTGFPFIGLSDGRLESYLYEPKVEKGMELWDYIVDNSFARSYPSKLQWSEGNTLFYCSDESFYSDTAQKYMRKYEWSENDIGVVPVPFSPDAEEKYYYYDPGIVYAYVEGSDNPEGAAAWFECANELSNSEEYKEKMRSALKKDYYWTDELLDRIDEFEANGTPIIELSFGSDYPSDIFSYEPMIDFILNREYLYGETTYEERRDLKKDDIEQYVSEFNEFFK